MINIDELMKLLEKAFSSELDKTKITYSDRRLLAKYIIKTKKYSEHAERALNNGLVDLSHDDFDDYCYETLEMDNVILRIENELQSRLNAKLKSHHELLSTIDKTASMFSDKASKIEGAIKGKEAAEKTTRVKKAKFAAKKRHEPTNKAKEELKKIWASGKYTSRDICAEQECGELRLSFSTARKALRNTPKPTSNS